MSFRLSGPSCSGNTTAVGTKRFGTDLLLGEMVAEVLEAQPALQREPVERPPILRIQREDALVLMLIRSLIGVHRQLIGNAAPEVVIELRVVVEVLRERRVVLVKARTEFRRVRPGHVGHGPLRRHREPGVPRPIGAIGS